MELYQLATFLAVAREHHLTRAAETLHLSQPAVSAQIKALEQELEVRLFERHAGGMTITAAGSELLAHARKTVEAAEALKRAARASRGQLAGKLRIGTASNPERIRLGELLGRTVERYPRLELELLQMSSGAAIESVRDGRLAASYFFGEIAAPGVTGLLLGELVYRVAAPGAWRDRVCGADWDRIVAMPWITTPAMSTHRQLVGTLFAEYGGRPLAQHVEADSEFVIDNLIASGVGVSLMLEDVALERQRAGEICIWEPARVSARLWFAYREERADDPLLRALLEVLREIWPAAQSPPASQSTSSKVRRSRPASE